MILTILAFNRCFSRPINFGYLFIDLSKSPLKIYLIFLKNLLIHSKKVISTLRFWCARVKLVEAQSTFQRGHLLPSMWIYLCLGLLVPNSRVTHPWTPSAPPPSRHSNHSSSLGSFPRTSITLHHFTSTRASTKWTAYSYPLQRSRVLPISAFWRFSASPGSGPCSVLKLSFRYSRVMMRIK